MKQYRIEEICEVISGGTPSTKVANYWNGDIVWLTPKDLSNITTKWISRSSNKITKDGLDNSAARMLPINAVLLSSRAPIGYLALAKKPLCTNQGFKSMICNTNYILPEYLYYYLHTKVEELNNISTGSTFKELSSSLLKNYVVSIHDLTTQQHIVDILGSIDEKIENNEKIISNVLKLYRLKFRNLAMKYEQKTALSYIASVESGKRPLHKSAALDGSFNIPIIGASSIMGYTDDYLFNEPILVIGRVGTLGVVQSIFGKSYPSDNALIIRSKYYTFCYCALNELDYNSLNKGSTQPLITQTDIKNIQIPLIPQSELQQFEMHNKIDIIVALKEENNMLRELKALNLKKFFE